MRDRIVPVRSPATVTRDVPTFIYALVDPRDGVVRYVGSTVDVGARLSSHMSKPLRRLARWISELRALGTCPRADTLAIVPAGQDWIAEERFWIEYQSWRTSLGKAALANRDSFGSMNVYADPLDGFAVYDDKSDRAVELYGLERTQPVDEDCGYIPQPVPPADSHIKPTISRARGIPFRARKAAVV